MLSDNKYQRIYVVKYTNKFAPGKSWLKETYYSFTDAHNRIAELEKLSYISEMQWSRSKVKQEYQTEVFTLEEAE